MEWITAAEAARRLNVKPATLYAYVSRGVLGRRQEGRSSLFDAGEIERLVRRGRPRNPGDLVIESRITTITAEHCFYRGKETTALARERTFEEVAGWLWTGEMGEPGPWGAGDGDAQVARAAQGALPDGTLPLERLQVIVPALAATDPMRLHLDPPGVIEAARRMINGMIDSLPARHARPAAGTIAERLWPCLTSTAPRPAFTRALQAALVLLADHELAASTVAVRVAASVRADPYAAVSAGLGVMSGALHGGASLGAERLLAEDDPPRAIGDLLRRGERVPGLGHYIYKNGDPRALHLMGELGEHMPAAATAVLDETRRRRLPEPNIDFALAALTDAAGMVRGAGEVVFAIARTAGWIAHALEEYARNKPLRPRAIYAGPEPDLGTDDSD